MAVPLRLHRFPIGRRNYHQIPVTAHFLQSLLHSLKRPAGRQSRNGLIAGDGPVQHFFQQRTFRLSNLPFQTGIGKCICLREPPAQIRQILLNIAAFPALQQRQFQSLKTVDSPIHGIEADPVPDLLRLLPVFFHLPFFCHQRGKTQLVLGIHGIDGAAV